MAQNCASDQAEAQREVLPQEYRLVLGSAHTLIAEGATTYAAFKKALADDYGERFVGYAPDIWKEAVSVYNATLAGIEGMPQVQQSVADVMPAYKSMKNVDANIQNEIKQSLIEIAQLNQLNEARGGTADPKKKGVLVKGLADTAKAGTVLWNDPASLKALRDAGIPFDEILNATVQLRDNAQNEVVQLGKEIAKLESMLGNDTSVTQDMVDDVVMQQAYAAQTLRWATAEAAGAATEAGRALRALRDIRQLQRMGSQALKTYASLFGLQPVSKPLVRPEDAEAIKLADSITPQTEAQIRKDGGLTSAADASQGVKRGRSEWSKGPKRNNNVAGRSINIPGLEVPGVSNAEAIPFVAKDPTQIYERAIRRSVVKDGGDRTRQAVEKLTSAKSELADALDKFKSDLIAPRTSAVLGAPIPVDVIKALAKVAFAHLELGLAKYSDYRDAIKSEHEDIDEDLIKAGWSEAQRLKSLRNVARISGGDEAKAETDWEAGIEASVKSGERPFADVAKPVNYDAKGRIIPGNDNTVRISNVDPLDATGRAQNDVPVSTPKKGTAPQRKTVTPQGETRLSGGGEFVVPVDNNIGRLPNADVIPSATERGQVDATVPSPNTVTTQPRKTVTPQGETKYSGGGEVVVPVDNRIDRLPGTENPVLDAGLRGQRGATVASPQKGTAQPRKTVTPQGNTIFSGGGEFIIPVDNNTGRLTSADTLDATGRAQRSANPEAGRRSRDTAIPGTEDPMMDASLRGQKDASPEAKKMSETKLLPDDILQDAPETGDGRLFTTEQRDRVRDRLRETYAPPADGRDGSTLESLKLYGGAVYETLTRENGVKPDFFTWAVRMKSSTGHNIASGDLMHAWDNMRDFAFKNKVRPEKDIKKEAMRRASKILDPEQLAKFENNIRGIDPTGPNASKEFAAAIDELRKTTWKEYIREIPSFRRAIRTAFDASAPFMQGAIYTLNPLKIRDTVRNFGEMMKSLANDDYAREVMKMIGESKNAEIYDRFGKGMFSKFGGDISVLDHEEAFSTRVFDSFAEASLEGAPYRLYGLNGPEVNTAKSIRMGLLGDFLKKNGLSSDGNISVELGGFTGSPAGLMRGISRQVRASERAYTVYLNLQRMQAMDAGIKNLQKRGIEAETHPESYQALADLIGDFTGRSTMGKAEDYSQALSWIFFSPRFQLSRVKALAAPGRALASYAIDKSPRAIKESGFAQSTYLPKEVRKTALKDMGGALAGLSTILSLALLGGAQVNLDPTDSDFLKGRFRNITIDFSGGLANWVRLFAQTLPFNQRREKNPPNSFRPGIKGISDNSGKNVTNLGGGFGEDTVLEQTGRSIWGKVSPTIKDPWQFYTGQDDLGSPIFLGNFKGTTNQKEAWKRFVTDVANNFGPLSATDLVGVMTDKDITTAEKVISMLAIFGANVRKNKQEHRRPAMSN